MISILRDFLGVLLIPLSFLPASIQIFFAFTVGFFSLFIVAKCLKWLWDILPIA